MKAVKAETKEKQIKVLELLEGYRWSLGQKPTEYIPYERNGPEFHYIKFDEDKKTIKTATKMYPGQEEISYQQFISKNKKVIL